jgi:hypothetical protein
VVSDPGYAEAMGNRGYKRIGEDFSEEVWVKRINSVLALEERFLTISADARRGSKRKNSYLKGEWGLSSIENGWRCRDAVAAAPDAWRWFID